MLNRTDYRKQHPDDRVLLAYLDCEQQDRNQAEVRAHLESCWQCRAQLRKVEDTISAFVDFRDQVFSAESVQPPRQFSGFSTKLSQLHEQFVDEKTLLGTVRAVREWWESAVRTRVLNGWSLPAAVITAMLAIAVGFSLLGRDKESAPSGGSLLAQSAAADSIDRNQLLKRTLIVEQKDAASGRIVRRSRIESWKSGADPRAVRRVYDEDNTMVAGYWIKADGSRVQYHPRDGKAHNQLEEQLPGGDSVWDVSPSASDFGRLVGTDAPLTVEVMPTAYVLRYADTSTAQPRLRSATLTLRRRDLHAVEQAFVIEKAGVLNEYRIAEIEYERRNFETADAKYFEPDPTTNSFADPLEPPPQPVFVPATLDQEVQLFDSLDNAGALVGEQLEISYLPSRALRLEGLVSTPERRDEILHALGGLANSPAVQLELNTLAEAQQRHTQLTSTKIRLDEIEIENTAFPAESDLRAHLLAQGFANDSVGEQAYQLSSAALEDASLSREHVVALDRVAGFFSRDQVNAMGDAARAQWASMVQRHATQLSEHLRQLRTGIGPAFGHPQTLPSARTPKVGNFWEAVRQLDSLVTSIDDGVRGSLTVRANEPGAVVVKRQEFWDSVDHAIALADGIAADTGNR